MIRPLFSLLPIFLSTEKKHAMATFGSVALGLASVLVASAFIQIEINLVSLPKHADRIFQVNKWLEKPDGERLSSNKTAGLLAPALINQLPEVEAIARIMPWTEEVFLRNANRGITTKAWSFADPAFLKVFDVPFIKGDATTALNKPGQVVLTESMARHLFGSTDIIGKSMVGLGGKTYRVSGVVRNPEKQSKVQYAALASWASTEPTSGVHNFRFMNNWIGQTVETYILLHHAEEAHAAENHLLEVLREAAPGQAGEYPFFLHPLVSPAQKSGAVGPSVNGKFSDVIWDAGTLFLLFSLESHIS